MINVIRKCLLLIAIILPSSAWAADGLLTDKYKECLDKNFDNTSWNICGYEEIARQEIFIKEAWEQATDAMQRFESAAGEIVQGPNSPLDDLRVEQDNWNKWKESACEYYKTPLYGREENVLSYPACKARMIAGRIGELKAITLDLQEKLKR